MATKYWYGGAGNWNSGTAHWSLNSGNSPASTTSNPTSSDDVIFDGNSGTGNATVNVTMSIKSLTCVSGYTGTINGTGTLNISGSLILTAGMTYNRTADTNFIGTSGSSIIDTAGLTTRGRWWVGGSAGGLTGVVYTLQNNVNMPNGVIYVKQATFDTNSKNITTNYIAVFHDALIISLLKLRNSTITLASINAGADAGFQVDNAGDFDCGTSTIIFNSAFVGGFNSDGLNGNASTTVTFYNVTTSDTSVQPLYTFGNININTLTLGADSVTYFNAGKTVTLTNPLVSNGTSGHLATLQSDTAGTPATISKSSGTVNVKFMSIKDSTATGGAVWAAAKSTNVSGNTGWRFVDGNFLFFTQ